jgi:hypothetical protein
MLEKHEKVCEVNSCTAPGTHVKEMIIHNSKDKRLSRKQEGNRLQTNPFASKYQQS